MSAEQYIPSLNGDQFRVILIEDREKAYRTLLHEAYCVSRFIKRVLRAEGFGFWSRGRGQRRRALFAQASQAVLDEAGDLGPFAIDMMLGVVEVRDLEAVQVQQAARKRRAEEDQRLDDQRVADRRYYNSRTGEIRTADEMNMDILFGRARSEHFSVSGQSN